jgi:hypothetical protein
MKYRDVITVFLVLGLLLSLAFTLGVASSVWFWVVPIAFFVGVVWDVYYLWLT